MPGRRHELDGGRVGLDVKGIETYNEAIGHNPSNPVDDGFSWLNIAADHLGQRNLDEAGNAVGASTRQPKVRTA